MQACCTWDATASPDQRCKPKPASCKETKCTNLAHLKRGLLEKDTSLCAGDTSFTVAERKVLVEGMQLFDKNACGGKATGWCDCS